MTKTTGRRPMNEGVAFLIESDLERAELVLSAKSITDMLQKMAEQLARIEANELMPLLDPMRTAFGPQVADSFNRVVTEKARGLIEQVKQAKEAIGIEISRLEGSMDGKAPNDMQVEPTPAPEEPPAPAPEPDAGQDNAMGGDSPSDDMGDDDGDDTGDDKMGADKMGADKGSDPFASLFSDDNDGGGNAAGRGKKESYAPHKRPMRENFNRAFDDASGLNQIKSLLANVAQESPATAEIAKKLEGVLQAGGQGRSLDDGYEGVLSAVLYTISFARKGDRATLLDMLDTFDEKYGDDYHAFDPQHYDQLLNGLRALARTLLQSHRQKVPMMEKPRADESAKRKTRPVIEVAGKPLPAIPLLAESSDPDALVLKRFRRLLGEGISPATAARRTADAFTIDVVDVVEIVKEAAASRVKLDEKGKVPPQFLKHQKGKQDGDNKKSKKDGVDDDGDGTPDWEDKDEGKKDKSSKKPDADKDGVPNWADKNPHKKGDQKKERKDESVRLREGYEKVVLLALKDAGISGHFENGKLYVEKGGKAAALKAIKADPSIHKAPEIVEEGVGKSARPFAGTDRPATVSEAITDQRKAELQQMGYAVNVTGKGFQWVRPKPGSSANNEQGQRPNRNEDDAWRELDGHVKKQADQLVRKLNTPAGRKGMPLPGQAMQEADGASCKPQPPLRKARSQFGDR